MQRVRSHRFRMHLDAASHLPVGTGMERDLGQHFLKLFARRCAWCTECVVLVESVAVEEMNLFHWRLRDKVEDVGASSAQADDSDPQQLKLVIDCHNISPAAG